VTGITTKIMNGHETVATTGKFLNHRKATYPFIIIPFLENRNKKIALIEYHTEVS